MAQDDSLSSLSLDDLANETGFDRRVIRSFIEQGLLRGPDSMGRYARYSQTHLERLLAIKTMRNVQGLPLPEVRRQLLSMSHQDIQLLAADAVNSGSVSPNDVDAFNAKRSASNTDYNEGQDQASALDYIRGVEQKQQQDAAAKKGGAPGLAQQLVQAYQHLQQRHPAKPPKTPLDHLLGALMTIKGMNRVRRHSRSETWQRISITPDIELTVRGDLSAEELRKLERVADCIREILMGG